MSKEWTVDSINIDGKVWKSMDMKECDCGVSNMEILARGCGRNLVKQAIDDCREYDEKMEMIKFMFGEDEETKELYDREVEQLNFAQEIADVANFNFNPTQDISTLKK